MRVLQFWANKNLVLGFALTVLSDLRILKLTKDIKLKETMMKIGLICSVDDIFDYVSSKFFCNL
jgi:hypothetical protein